MKTRPVAAELFHTDGRTDGQTDMANLMVAFRNLANAPKNSYSRYRDARFEGGGNRFL